MSSPQRPQVFLRRLARPALAVGATLLTLLAGEVLVRVLGRAPGIKPIPLSSYDCIYQRSTNPILGFELKANYRCDTPDFIQTYERTNSHGQRDRERTLRKPHAGASHDSPVRRILLLGDSVVEGYGLRESETMSRQLEDLYGDGSTEILNFGVSAYCTRAEIELLEVKGLRFDPDVVVLVFVENDFDNFNREAFPLGGTIPRPAVVKALFRRSHLFRVASIQLNLFHFGAEVDPLRWNRAAIGDNNVFEGLRRFRELADRHGFEPLVVIWPRFLDDRIADVCFLPAVGARDPNREESRLGTPRHASGAPSRNSAMGAPSPLLVVEHLAAMCGIPSVRLSAFFRQHQAQSAGTGNPRRYYSLGDELHPSRAGCRVAAEALQQILADPNVGRVPPARGVARSVQNDAQAIAAAKALGQTQPNYARVHNRLGTELLKADRLTEAVVQFQQALEADPTHAGAHNNLGITYERLGREDAQVHFERAIQLEPDFTHAHYNLARILMQKGREAEAVVWLQRTIGTDPNHVDALNMLGTALGRQQKFAEAASHLERAVRLNPSHAEAHHNLGAAYAGQGRLHEAVVQFEAALRLAPNDPETLEALRSVRAALRFGAGSPHAK
jgi:Flp pilus assembly protein TadD